jgi:hypothetical protein
MSHTSKLAAQIDMTDGPVSCDRVDENPNFHLLRTFESPPRRGLLIGKLKSMSLSGETALSGLAGLYFWRPIRLLISSSSNFKRFDKLRFPMTVNQKGYPVELAATTSR